MIMDELFYHSVRVYAEDTDMTGIVYHSNYLCFFERARSELLRKHGLQLSNLSQYDCHFAIKEAQLRYLKPARLDDLLSIETKIEKAGACVLLFKQNLFNEDGQKLCEAEVQVVSVDKNLKPKRLPVFLFEQVINT